MSNPLEIELHVEVMEIEGMCSECKIEGDVLEFVLFIGMEHIETGKQFCKYCYEELDYEEA